jgi:adenylate cyclase
MLKFLELGGASVAALDILFTEPSSYGVNDDQTFAEAMHGKLPIVVASALRNTELRQEPHTAELFRHKVQTHSLFPAVQHGLQSLPKAPTFISAQTPIPELLEAAAILGNVSADPD